MSYRFRKALGESGLADALMREVNRQLAARGLILKRGRIVDAALIVRAVAPPTLNEDGVTERGPQAGLGGRLTRRS